MSVSDIAVTRVGMLQRTGHMVHADVSAQFFYGRTRQVRAPTCWPLMSAHLSISL
jgi:hypothetical protein